jgi:phage terminase Nu1 subunit (DNA packaging protein)
MALLDSVVGVQEFASLVGVSRRAVSDLIKRGVLERPLVLGPAVRSYVDYIQTGAASAKTERARLASEQADAWAIKNQVARRELMSISEIETTWADIILRTRDAVLGVSDRLMAVLPHLSRHDGAKIAEALRDALIALSRSTT